jgi:hypothetical protein
MGKHGAWMAVAGVVAALVSADGLVARAKPVASLPGQFQFDETLCHAVISDQALGDCDGLYATVSGATSVELNPNREFRATLAGERHVRLDLSSQVEPPECGIGCARTFGAVLDVAATMQTNVVDAANLEIANGLLGVGIGGARARFYFTFPDPDGRGFNWSVLFNPQEYPGATLLHVTRIDSCSWRLEAPPGTKAGLRGWNAVKKGRGGSTNEGLFAVSFAIDFTAPGCGA